MNNYGGAASLRLDIKSGVPLLFLDKYNYLFFLVKDYGIFKIFGNKRK